MGGDGELARGREAARRLHWADAYAALTRADRSSPLDAEDLELLATAAFLLGHVEDCLGALRRAQQLHAEAGEPRQAARCALWLAFHLGTGGEPAQAGGWLARANRLLEQEPPDCAERGHLLLPVAIQHIVAGDNAAARELAARAAGIGRRSGDADLAALALQVQGRALVGLGRVGEAMAAFDEAMVAVVAGELSPVVVGTVYCSLLEACQEILEWRRAREWTEALTAWCGSQPAMVAYSGRCLVHRAELLHLHGAWQEAVEEARRAGERLARAPDSFATGAAFYQQAEVHRVLGELAEAEDAYRPAAAGAHGLTGRELQVLRLLATGKTNRAIAAELVLAEKTVHRHVSNIFTKLGVPSRAAATAYAYRHRLL